MAEPALREATRSATTPGESAALPRHRAGTIPWTLRAFIAVAGILARLYDLGAAYRGTRRGPWRVVVEERSMAPVLLPGDWLLCDPTPSRWPRRGAIVVVREPGSEILAVKRVAGRPGDVVPAGDGPPRRLGPWEAWLLGDARDVSVDSRRYGPLDLERLVGRAWFRYGPANRLGRLDGRPR